MYAISAKGMAPVVKVCIISYFCMSQELYSAGYIYSCMLSYKHVCSSDECDKYQIPIPFRGLLIAWSIVLCHLYKDRTAASLTKLIHDQLGA